MIDLFLKAFDGLVRALDSAWQFFKQIKDLF